MSLFTDVVELSMRDPSRNLIEKFAFDAKKPNIEFVIDPSCDAIVNGVSPIAGGQRMSFSRKVIGNSISVCLYSKAVNRQVVSIPFFAGQHTISLEVMTTAKARFALVGVARVAVANPKNLVAYFNSTLTLEELENKLVESLKDSISTMMTSAASRHINSASTDKSIYENLSAIAADGIANTSMRKTLSDMGLRLMPDSIDLKLNPIGDSSAVIEAINAKFNEAAIGSFDEAAKDKQRRQDVEDEERRNQHEIDVINAKNTDTKNRNNSNSYSYNGKPPVEKPKKDDKPKKRFCSNCGNELGPKDRFCSVCGTPAK